MTVSAQTTKGIVVINELTKKPLNYIHVSSIDNSFNQYTDENGYISLNKTDLTHQKINVSRIGYVNENFDFDTLEVKKRNRLHLGES